MKFPFASCFLVASILALGRTGWAQEAGVTVPTESNARSAEYREDLKRGDALYGTGTTLAWTGAALLPLSLLALIPVVYDGAFGITAADPGIGGFIAAAGVGLIHIGIPFMGVGADRLEAGTKGAKPGYEPSKPSG